MASIMSWAAVDPKFLTNYLFFSAAILLEAIERIGLMGREFRYSEAYKNGFGAFFKDPDTIEITRLTRRIRSQTV